tara:strand:+ start:1370 stop:3157 length:1788 start_codon:yes stop_codon:yes gene_type:complete
MKYNDIKFDNAVKYYESRLKGKVEDKLVFLVSDINNKKAFFSIAPLSRAIHELGGDLHVIVKNKESENFQVLRRVWHIFEDMNKGLKTKKTDALRGFINEVNKRTKTKVFKNIFKKPEIMLYSNLHGFTGTLDLDYKNEWYKKYRWAELVETTGTILKKGYDLKKGEKLGLTFELIPKEEDLELPLEDYLDSYSIAMAMSVYAKKLKASIGLGSCSNRFSVLANSVRSSDLMSTIVGCELEKDIDEDVFKKFKILSPFIGSQKIEFNDAGFGIHGKGYHGKAFFGEHIGYPTPNKKTRWSSPGQMMLKDRYEAQSKEESRDPKMRYAMTETLPIDIFIQTCNVDYSKIRARSAKIKKILDKCDFIRIIGNEMVDGHKTDFTVHLVNEDKTVRREFVSSDSDVTTKIDKDYYKSTGIKCGLYANFPSGEAFVTPEKVEGTVVGDVVISIDQSYRLDKGKPLVIKVKDYKYSVISGPKKIVDKMNSSKKDSMEKLRGIEKSGALPKSITNMYRKCFNYIGEFAVNLNPKAKLCDYLIVNEKIAKMMHVAMGMGFEPDRKTLYHWDMVINSPKQKMDVYGVDSKHKVHWIIKEGKFKV